MGFVLVEDVTRIAHDLADVPDLVDGLEVPRWTLDPAGREVGTRIGDEVSLRLLREDERLYDVPKGLSLGVGGTLGVVSPIHDEPNRAVSLHGFFQKDLLVGEGETTVFLDLPYPSVLLRV